MAYSEIIPDIPPDAESRYAEHGVPVFIAYGCILLERFTGKTYTYTAINLDAGKKECIGRRKRPVSEPYYPEMAGRIKQSAIAEKGRIEISSAPGARTGRNKLREAQDVLFKEIMPMHGFGVRGGQIELAEHMLETLCGKGITLAEAEVGTGKTHAYLIASTLVKRGRFNDLWVMGNYPGISYDAGCAMPVVISTSSIMLQRAIIKEYIPALSQMLMEHGEITSPLTAILRKGKEHYICETRLLECVKSETGNETNELFSDVLKNPNAVDLDELSSLNSYQKKKVCVIGPCPRGCPQKEHCRYLKYLNKAVKGKYDFQVCNHNYLLADAIHRSQGRRPLIPAYQAVIIDEAHKFQQAARQLYGVSVSSIALPYIMNELLKLPCTSERRHATLKQDAGKLISQNKKLFDRLDGNTPNMEYSDGAERYATKFDVQAERALSNILKIAGRLEDKIETYPVWHRKPLERIKGMLQAQYRKFNAFRSHRELVYWLEKISGEVCLGAIPKNLPELLHKDIWSKGIPMILTSGTLSAAGSFGHIKRNMGLDKLRKLTEISKPSPFDHKKNALLYISESVPFPDYTSPAYISALADEIRSLIIAGHGHTVILFTSYSAMTIVFGLVKQYPMPFPLFMLKKGSMKALHDYRKSGNGVLFATGGLWEGVNLPGDILSSLIIAKLPFSVPDPISEYEQTLYSGIDEYKNKVVVPEMLLKLKQGFGRLIRSETDTGVVAILDSRARMGGPYRGRVLDALPDMHVTSDKTYVNAFIRDVKSPGFFIGGRNI